MKTIKTSPIAAAVLSTAQVPSASLAVLDNGPSGASDSWQNASLTAIDVPLNGIVITRVSINGLTHFAVDLGEGSDRCAAFLLHTVAAEDPARLGHALVRPAANLGEHHDV